MADDAPREPIVDPVLAVVGLIVVAICAMAALAGHFMQRDMASKHKPFPNITLQRDVIYVTGRKWPIVERITEQPHLRMLEQTAGDIALIPNFASHLKPSPEVTILIHGFSAPEQDLVSYFADIVGVLKAERPVGTSVVYDWPSTAVRFDMAVDIELRAMNSGGQNRGGLAYVIPTRQAGWELAMYAGDREKARGDGAPGLVRLISLIREHMRPGRLNIVAHSMGSYVVMEAMRESPGQMKGLHHVVLLAPDLPIQALDAPTTKDVLATAASVHVFHSRNDVILGYSESANRDKSLGRHGPPDAGRSTNVNAHDMTEALGTADVHGKYLTRQMAREILAKTLLAR